jgi:DnaK suppressor protein
MNQQTPLVPPDYRPGTDEPFMNPVMREYFRQRLIDWKSELLRESGPTLQHLQDDTVAEPDVADRASQESDRVLDLRRRERARKLIFKIDAVMEKFDDGTYGYCEDTDEPIGVERLDARPIATLSIEAQELHERRERTQRDD